MRIETVFVCEICGKRYNTEDVAAKCEAQGVEEFDFNVGEEVFLVRRFPDTADKPFVKRTITDAWKHGHSAKYSLNQTVLVGKDFYVGADSRGMGAFNEEVGLFPARNEHLHRFGEIVECWTSSHNGEEVLVCEKSVDLLN